MIVDFAVTAAVLVTVAKLLEDDRQRVWPADDVGLRGTPARLRAPQRRSRLSGMPEPRPAEPDLPERAIAESDDADPESPRPTVDEMSEWSFPASDPPATWTWDVERPFRR